MVRAKKGWRIGIILLVWLSAAYFCLVPLIRSRGVYIAGHYRLIDIYFGLPLFLFSVCLTVFVLGRTDRRQKLALKLFTMVFSILLTIGLADTAYAFVIEGAWQASPTDVWFDGVAITRKDNQPDSELGFVRRPGIQWQGRLSPEARDVTYRTDENGFRNGTGITQADAVFVGDSFTEGASVPEEETFVQKFGRGSKLRAVNLGRGHYGPQQEAIVLKRYGLNYHPRLVVWQIFEGNDLSDASNFAAWKANPPRESIMLRYTKRSVLARLLAFTVRKDSGVERPLDEGAGKTGRLFLDYVYRPDEPSRNPAGMNETKKAIEDAFRLCQSSGIKFVILFIPIKVRVLGPYIRFRDHADRDFYLPGGQQDSHADFAAELKKFCKQLDCPFIDMTPALRGRATEDNRYVYSTAQDSHLDIDGHTVVAQVLQDWFKAQAGPRPSTPASAGKN